MPNKKPAEQKKLKEEAEGRTRRTSKGQKKVVITSSESEESDIEDRKFEEDMEKKIEKVMKKIMTQFKKEITAELKEFEKSLAFNGEKIDDFILEMKDMKDKQVVLMKENVMLKEKMKNMEKDLEELQQYTRNHNIQIDGIPVQKEENLEQIVQEIGNAINVEIKDGEIDVVHRIPTRSSNNPEPIVVQFLSRRKRDEIIIKAKAKRITTNSINMTGPEKKIFINDHLTKERKQLLYQAKQKKLEKNYKFVWTRNGKIFMRKNETSNVIQIHQLDDLDEIQ